MIHSHERNIRLILEYDGTHFKGLQLQPGKRTIQGELETSLHRLFGIPVSTIAAGRTDTGVHALGQVINFKTTTHLKADRIQNALNALLPEDIVVRETGMVPPDFHARYSASRRKYLYRIGYKQRAIGRGYNWWIRRPLNLKAMQNAAAMLLGCHDFTSFCVAASKQNNRECHIFECIWQEHEDGIQFLIEANRFLRSMVRSIVGTLVDVGKGKHLTADIVRILDAKDRANAGQTAPPQGLFLMQVTYADYRVK